MPDPSSTRPHAWCRSCVEWSVRVASQKERGVTYTVDWALIGAAGRYRCSCKGYRFHPKPGTPCAHIQAAAKRHCRWVGTALTDLGRCPQCGGPGEALASSPQPPVSPSPGSL